MTRDDWRALAVGTVFGLVVALLCLTLAVWPGMVVGYELKE